MDIRKIINITSKTLLFLAGVFLTVFIAGFFAGFESVPYIWLFVTTLVVAIIMEAVGYVVTMLEFLVATRKQTIQGNAPDAEEHVFKTEHEWLQEGKIIDKSKAVYPESATRNRIGY